MTATEALAAHRPLLHFSVPSGWSNDPNGLICHEGWYHLYYQHYPHAPRWDDMHWGHARSRDLLHWDPMPIALFPDANGTIFSGSMVFDRDNTSGLGTPANPPLVAMFTQDQSARRQQVQSIAWSLDGGTSFTMYEGNPVLTCPEKPDFRDPKVFWNEQADAWGMVLAAEKELFFYTSPNLLDWTQTGRFADAEETASAVWECPDLFMLDDRWVLSLSLGVPRGTTPSMIYYIGTFDGAQFVPDPGCVRIPLDGGYDDYAAVTFADTPGRKLLLGWMRGFNADDAPHSGFRGSMTVPRELSLWGDNGEKRLIQTPAREVFQQITATETFSLPAGSHPIPLSQVPCWIDARATGSLTLCLENDQDRVVVELDLPSRKLSVDTTACGSAAGQPGGLQKREEMTFVGNAEVVQILLDTTSVEVFTANHSAVLTSQFLLERPFSRLNWTCAKSAGECSVSYLRPPVR